MIPPPTDSRAASRPAEEPATVFRTHLARQGLKYTRERQEVLEAVFETHEHFDADQLYLRLRQRNVKTSKATIYRALQLLCGAGLLREVFRGPHGASYEHVYGHAHHEHMICLGCNKVTEFTSRRLEQLQEEACQTHGFRPIRHFLQVFGYCKDCQAAQLRPG